jgi:LuxR family transcriptional regulator, maltose regulon positive regulatory protein
VLHDVSLIQYPVMTICLDHGRNGFIGFRRASCGLLLKSQIFKSISNVLLEGWMHILRQAESTVVRSHNLVYRNLYLFARLMLRQPDCAPAADIGAQCFAERQLVIQKNGWRSYNRFMPVPVLTTKLHIPLSRSKVVMRPQLVARLNEGLYQSQGFGRKLTLVCAPAGFGKTSLITEWLATYQYPVAWLSLDDGDGEIRQFLAYLIAALQVLEKDIGADVLGMLESSQLPPAESLLTSLLNEIAVLQHDFMLVLDDYHTVDSKPIDRALAYLLDHLPPQMHLVITTREDPSLPLARFRARGQLTELRAADLRFSPGEAAEFLNQVMALDLSADQLAILESRTEGWVAGLQLAALSMQGNQDIPGFIQSFTGAHQFVLDYLLEEVLQRQTENIQTFLLQTSILDRLCGPLCDAVLSDTAGSGQKTLEYLHHSNLFVTLLDHERRWYRYHQLFSDLLCQRLGQNLSTEEIAGLHLRASEWYERNGDVYQAFQHALAAQDFSRAAGIAEMAWQGMNESFQNAAWLGWVHQLPEESIRLRPVLCTQMAWSFMDAGEVNASESRLQVAERLLNGPSEKIVVVEESQFRALRARIAFARAYNALAVGNGSDALEHAEKALQLTPDEDQYLRAQTKAILTSAHWANGKLDAAYSSMSEWIQNAQRAGNIIFAIASAHGAAEILIAQGRLQEAVRTYEQSLQLASTAGREAQRFTANHHLGLAMLYLEMGNNELAAQYLQTGLELGLHCTQPDWPYHKCIVQARWKEYERDLHTAVDLLEEARRVYIRTLMPDAHPAEAWKARVYLKLERLSHAQNWAQEHRLTVDDDLSYMHEFAHLTLARVLLAAYQRNRAEADVRDVLHLLGRLLKAAEAGKRTGSIIEVSLLQALAHHARGNKAQALVSLKRAVTLAEPEGYVRIFVDEGQVTTELLTDLSEVEGLKEYIRKLLSAFGEQSDAHVPTPSQPLIDPLSDRELEVLRLVAQGLSNDKIGKRLYLSVNTVKGHNLRIFGKLQVKSRTEAVARARELGLL